MLPPLPPLPFPEFESVLRLQPRLSQERPLGGRSLRAASARAGGEAKEGAGGGPGSGKGFGAGDRCPRAGRGHRPAGGLAGTVMVTKQARTAEAELR